MEHSSIKRIVAGVAAATLAAGLALPAVTASADDRSGYKTNIEVYPGDQDPGGSSGRVMLYKGSEPAARDYDATFDALGEIFELRDYKTDGHRAEARVVIYNKSGNVVFDDLYRAEPGIRLDLEVPGHKDNIPEGYKVRIQIRPEGMTWSDPAVYTA